MPDITITKQEARKLYEAGFEDIAMRAYIEHKLGYDVNITKLPTSTLREPDGDTEKLLINNAWAASVGNGKEGLRNEGAKIAGSGAMLFLENAYGKWYDEEGNELKGYLYYKPHHDYDI